MMTIYPRKLKIRYHWNQLKLYLDHCFSCDGYEMGEDEITHATVGLVLDSLDDIHCLTEARHKDTEFLDNILHDDQLHALLNLYDQISTNTYRPFR